MAVISLENALLLKEPNTVVNAVLTRFILNLRPQARNLSSDQLSSTVSALLADYFKTSERTVFWDEDLHMNVDPFQSLEGGFFSADWDLKLKILRQLVELQLSHSIEVKGKIDHAWGVHHNKNKKKDGPTAPPPPEDPDSQDNLQLLPIGQDVSRKRYWVADLSPRIYVSTNPWKITATFRTVSSTRDEYISLLEQLKTNAPPPAKKNVKKRPKTEIAHLQLIKALEERLEEIDKELVRVQKARRKIEQRHQDLLLAECRQLRSRRQVKKPDYVFANGGIDSEDDVDEYNQGEEEYEDDFEDPEMFDEETGRPKRSTRASQAVGQRRSTRTAVLNANGKREAAEDPFDHWRGERRSARLGAPPEMQLDYEPSVKRARTEDSSMATNSSPGPSDSTSPAPDTKPLNLHVKTTGAAALKPTEVALEAFAGKKRSKFWVYAVEPAPGAAPIASTKKEEPDEMVLDGNPPPHPPGKSVVNSDLCTANGATHSIDGHALADDSTASYPPPDTLRRSMEGSLSPMDES
ncbi:hypothetical protein V5O48_002550 [Marasmius crinis-equi]|uniref:WHIM1 domain-containing protein n=1 Tax=Marasmius crinis-equi TaxID=585013 RepID=A0ABR3FVD5_9AGAR